MVILLWFIVCLVIGILKLLSENLGSITACMLKRNVPNAALSTLCVNFLLLLLFFNYYFGAWAEVEYISFCEFSAVCKYPCFCFYVNIGLLEQYSFCSELCPC